MYDYNNGRFLSVDPILHGGSQGVNPYTYIFNNPLSGTDPTGYAPELWLHAYYYEKMGPEVAQEVLNAGKIDIPDELADSIFEGTLIASLVVIEAYDLYDTVTDFIPGKKQVKQAIGADDLVGKARQAVKGLIAKQKARANKSKVETNNAKVGDTSKPKKTESISETGSYTNTHASGKQYHGKGGKKRSQQSGKRVAEENNDPHVATDWTSAKNDREAFKAESRRLDEGGGKNSPKNYNKSESPGKKYRNEDKKEVKVVQCNRAGTRCEQK